MVTREEGGRQGASGRERRAGGRERRGRRALAPRAGDPAAASEPLALAAGLLRLRLWESDPATPPPPLVRSASAGDGRRADKAGEPGVVWSFLKYSLTFWDKN